MSHSKVNDELLPENEDTPAIEPEKSKTPHHWYYNARGTQCSKPGGDEIQTITPAEVSKYQALIEALRRELAMNATFVDHSFDEVNRRERQIGELKKRIVSLESKIVRLRGIVGKCIQCSKCNPRAAADKKTVS